MSEIVLGFWDFILLLVEIVVFILIIYIILYEYKNWRTKRLIRVTKANTGNISEKKISSVKLD